MRIEPEQIDRLTGESPDASFQFNRTGLDAAVSALSLQAADWQEKDRSILPDVLPEYGFGENAVLERLAPLVLGDARFMDGPTSFANMDPATPWITWAVTLWNARLNQNLLHQATSPTAGKIERRVVDWLAPFFGMNGGHLVPGSTIANLTGLWAARDLKKITEILAPDTAHVSIEKAARLLGLRYRKLPTERSGRLREGFEMDDERTCLVLVAGPTLTGSIDPLHLIGEAAWTHVDAAWAGPLRLSDRYAGLLAGIEAADSIAISAHKWLFQPKESALILFRDTATANDALSFAAPYLTNGSVGLLGSHGAVATPLLALLWAWGRTGLSNRLDQCMFLSQQFAEFIRADERLELFDHPNTGVVVWRPRVIVIEEFRRLLPPDLASVAVIAGEPWLRCVASNPILRIGAVIDSVRSALEKYSS